MKPSKYESELQALYNQHGKLTPNLVVEAAQDEDSLLHSYFEWDDEKAGGAYRLWQARQLIRTVRVTIAKGTQPVHLFVHVPSEDGKGEGEYQTRSVVAKSVDMRRRAINAAKQDVLAAQRNLEEVESLSKAKKPTRQIINQLATVGRQIEQLA